MSQLDVDGRNRRFWDELCGSGLARHLGITSDDPGSLQRFDAEYFKIYPYLEQYVPADKLRGKKVLEIGLGYGTMGGGGVPAGAGLIFEVELMAVNP